MAVCLPHYCKLQKAEFHDDLAHALTDREEDLILVIGFRSSAKTTFCSLAFVLYAALTARYKFIVLVNDTGAQLELNLANIKTEFDTNPHIKREFGISIGEEWSKRNLLLTNGVRIIGRTRGQKIRGIRHKENRPDLVIVDDPEDLKWVDKKDNRDSTERWFLSEVVPAQQEDNSKLIVIGNLLHNDALMSRLKKNPLFKLFEFPMFNDKGEVTWKAKYPNQEAVDKQRQKIKSPSVWSREYLLKVLPEEDQIIKDTDIKFYPNALLKELDQQNQPVLRIQEAGAGVDLAISQKQTADYTAIVPALKAKWENRLRIFIKPYPVIKRLDFDATIANIERVRDFLPYGAMFYVEGVGYQKVAIEQLKKKGISVKDMQPVSDKRARLNSVSHFIKDGTVVFAEEGCEELINQLVNFGIEEHDDACLVGETIVKCKRGDIRIDMVNTNDFVMTRKGWRRVLWAGQTGISETINNIGIEGTKNHPVITQKGVKELQYINESDVTYIWNEKRSCIEEKNIIDIQIQNAGNYASIFGATINGSRLPKHYIDRFGKTILEKSEKVMLFITKMATHLIMRSKILRVLPNPNIYLNTQTKQNDWNFHEETFSKPNQGQENGTRQMKDENGIENTQKKYGIIQENIRELVNDAKRNLQPFIKEQEHAELRADITSTCKREKKKVYNLLVEDEHEFLANGVLVHNCDALVYVILGLLRNGSMMQVDKIDRI